MEGEEEVVVAPAPVAPEVQEPPKATLEELMQPAYSKEERAAIESFFKKRAKNPVGYTYTARGDLETVQGAKAGARRRAEEAGLITLKRYIPIQPEELQLLEDARKEELGELDDAYEKAQTELRVAWDEYKITGAIGPVLQANQKVAEVDGQRNMVRSSERSIYVIENPDASKILLDQPNERRKLVRGADSYMKKVYRLSYPELPYEKAFGKYVNVTEAAAEAAEENMEGGGGQIAKEEEAYRTKLKDGRIARIFFSPEAEQNGFLSPMWPVEFTMDGMRYACALQAYEAERARELEKMELRNSLLKTRSGRTIRLMTRKVEGHPKDAKALWFRIYTAIYQQHEGLKKKLLNTGTDTLVYADERDGPSGIGFGEDNRFVLDPSRWRGENAAGLAQEAVRIRLREESLEEAPKDTNVKGGAITEEEQRKAKVGAIIAAARRRHPG